MFGHKSWMDRMIIRKGCFNEDGSGGNGGGGGGVVPQVTDTTTQATTTEQPVNPLIAWANAGNETVNSDIPATTETSVIPGAVPEVTPPAEPELILGKFKSQEEFIADYQAKQAQLDQLPQYQQQMDFQKQQLEMMQAIIQQQQKQPESAPKQEPQLTPKQIEQKKQEFQQRLYDDPISVLEEVRQQAITEAQKALEQQYAPMRQHFEAQQREAQWNNAVGQLAQANQQEFDALLPTMQKLTQQFGNLISQMPPDQAAKTVYDMAKSSYTPPTPAPVQKTPQEMLADPEFQKIVMADPNINKAIIQQYAQQIKAGQPPVVIGSQPGGQPPATPGESPRNAKEATKMANAWLRRQ